MTLVSLRNITRSLTRLSSLSHIRLASVPRQMSSVSVAQEKTAAAPKLPKESTQIQCSTKVVDSVGVVTFHTPNSKVNVLTMENGDILFETIINLIKENSAKNTPLKGIVLTSSLPGCFISGADINMIKNTSSVTEAVNLSATAHSLLARISALQLPVVAAVSGHCLGGGFELALSCDEIVALEATETGGRTNFGFPEVLLGILPGAGGTVKVYERLIATGTAPSDAISLLMTGRMLSPSAAKKLNLVQTVVKKVGPGFDSSDARSLDLLVQTAVNRAKVIKKRGAVKKADSESPLEILKGFSNALYDKYNVAKLCVIFFLAEKQALLKTHNKYPAISRILDTLKKMGETPATKEGSSARYQIEAKAFGELSKTKVSENLMGIYFKRTAAQKDKFPFTDSVYANGAAIKNIGVIGSGLMGSGITEVSANKGNYNVSVFDINAKSLDNSFKSLKRSFDGLVRRRKLSRFDADKKLVNLNFSSNFNDLKNCDMVIEAAAEDLTIKKRILADWENLKKDSPKDKVRPVFATNTSAIALKQIVEGCKHPENVVGMHYFSPVPKMELLEVVTHDKLNSDVLATAVNVGRKQGKLVVVVGDCPGFYTTRILYAALTEMVMLLNEGVAPQTIDKETLNFGFVYGSASLVDQVGVDVSYHILRYMNNEFKDRFKYFIDTNATETIVGSLIKKNALGAKTGRGLYQYGPLKPVLQNAQKLISLYNLSYEDQKDKHINYNIYPVLSKEMKQLKLDSKKHTLSDKVIGERIVAKFINECVLCLSEGVLKHPKDGDLAAIFGLGFPPFSGGPFQFIDAYGVRRLVDMMHDLAVKHNRPDFEPCDMLKKMAEDNKTFY